MKDKANDEKCWEKPWWNRREEGRTDGGGGMLHPAEYWLLVAIQEDGSCKPHTARLSAFSIRKSYILQTAPAHISGLCAATSWLVATLPPISYVCILYIYLEYVQRQVCSGWWLWKVSGETHSMHVLSLGQETARAKSFSQNNENKSQWSLEVA